MRLWVDAGEARRLLRAVGGVALLVATGDEGRIVIKRPALEAVVEAIKWEGEGRAAVYADDLAKALPRDGEAELVVGKLGVAVFSTQEKYRRRVLTHRILRFALVPLADAREVGKLHIDETGLDTLVLEGDVVRDAAYFADVLGADAVKLSADSGFTIELEGERSGSIVQREVGAAEEWQATLPIEALRLAAAIASDYVAVTPYRRSGEVAGVKFATSTAAILYAALR
ncbi:MAG: hypothetical protein DRJ67_04070 [Thermoprotei archaeon]|nr:MAG: hypothetical protein DRJ67_04070 [Thermoprotei archaeon]